jgi:hypothetical protein
MQRCVRSGLLLVVVVAVLMTPTSAFAVTHNSPNSAGYSARPPTTARLTFNLVVPKITCVATGENAAVAVFAGKLSDGQSSTAAAVLRLICDGTTPSYVVLLQNRGGVSTLAVKARHALTICISVDAQGQHESVLDVTSGEHTVLDSAIGLVPSDLVLYATNSVGGPLYSPIVFSSITVDDAPFSALEHVRGFDQTDNPNPPRLKVTRLQNGNQFKVKFV